MPLLVRDDEKGCLTEEALDCEQCYQIVYGAHFWLDKSGHAWQTLFSKLFNTFAKAINMGI